MSRFAGAVDRATLASLCLLAAVLPFEVRAPLFRVGPLGVTNVECALYLAVGLGFVGLLIDRRLLQRATAIHGAVLAWMGVVVLAALAAPEGRDAAFKFALRTAGGCLLCFVAAGAVRSVERALLVVAALMAGAAASGAVGLMEAFLPATREPLAIFREQPSLVGGLVRVSATFDYANTAAMYWEAVLPLAIAAGTWLTLTDRPGVMRGLAAVTVLIVTAALVLTLSRAGLLVGAASLVALLGVSSRALRPMRGYVAASAAGLLVLGAIAPATVELVTLRLRSDHFPDWYRPLYRIAPATTVVDAGATAAFQVTIRNDGLRSWPAWGEGAVALAYRWEDPQTPGTRWVAGDDVALPGRVDPGEEVTLDAVVRAPASPGQYRLVWDLVIDRVVWFSAMGAPTGLALVAVPASSRAVQALPLQVDEPVPLEPRIGRRALWRAAWQMWRDRPWLGVGPDNFRHLHGRYMNRDDTDPRMHANSLYVEVLATMGLLGFAALTAMAGAIAWQIRRGWRLWPSPPARAILAGFAVALAAFFVHGLVDYFLIFTPTYGLYWLLVGLTAGVTSRAAP